MPGAGFAGICGVESGKAAPLVGGPPGVVLHTVVEEPPSREVGDMVPVVLPTLGVEIVPSGAPGVIAVDDIVVMVDENVVAVLPVMDVEVVLGSVDAIGAGGAVMEGGGGAGIAGCGTVTVEPGRVDMNDVAGCADSAKNCVLPVADVEEVVGVTDTVGAADVDVVPVVPPVTDVEAKVTVGVPGPICPDGVEQVTKVPGVAGLEASGSGANIVSGTLGWVAAENGLGPLSGEDTIVPGVDERPMAVVPMVETCAALALQPNSRTAAVTSKRRIAIASFGPI